jgi:hypothetical protein
VRLAEVGVCREGDLEAEVMPRVLFGLGAEAAAASVG